MRYRSGPFEYDSNDACLRGPMGEIRLRKQLAETLALLWQRAPALVTLDDLLDEVWGRKAISPSAVPQVIRELRRVLGDQAQASEYLETRHRLGYRWMLPVVALPVEAGLDQDTTAVHASAVESLPSPALDAVRSDESNEAITAAAVGSPLHFRGAVILAVIAAGVLALWLGSRHSAPIPSATTVAGASAFDQARAAFDALDVQRAYTELNRVVDPAARDFLLGAQIALAQGDTSAAAAALSQARSVRPSPVDSRWIDALAALQQGRDVEAGRIIAALLAVTPDDLPLNLLGLEVRKKMPKATVSQIATLLTQKIDQLPAARRLMVRAQLAGLANDDARQLELANSVLQSAEAQQNRALWAWGQLLSAEALERMGKGEPAAEAALSAAKAFRQAGLPRAAVRALGRACSIAIDLPDYEATEQHIALALSWLAEMDDPAGLTMIQHYRAMLFNRREQFDEAVRAYTEQARRYEALGDLAFAATSLNSSAQPLYLLGRGNEVPAVLERAFTLASQANATDTAGYVLGSLANHYVRAGDLVQGEATYLRALERFRAAGLTNAEMTALGNLGELAMMQGRLSDALRHFAAAADLQQAGGNMIALASSERRQAELKGALGQLAAATVHAAAAVSHYQNAAAANEEASARRVLAGLQLQQAQLSEAQSTLAAGIHLAQSGPAARAELAVIRGSIAFEQGQLKEAQRAFTEALTLRGDTQEGVDRPALELAILEVRLANGENVAVEEEARRMLSQPGLRNQLPIRRRAQLLLLEALVVGNRRSEAQTTLPDVDAALERSPDAEDTLKVALLRSALDEDTATASERLDWVQQQASDNGMRRLALLAQGEALRRNPGRNAESWRKSVIATGLVRLLSAQKAVALN